MEENKQEEVSENKEQIVVNSNNQSQGLSKSATFIIIALIISISYIYTENHKIAYKEQLRQEEIQIQQQQKDLYQTCLDEVETNYISTWNDSCKKRKLKNDCLLPLEEANSIEKYRENSIKQCNEKLKNKAF